MRAVPHISSPKASSAFNGAQRHSSHTTSQTAPPGKFHFLQHHRAHRPLRDQFFNAAVTLVVESSVPKKHPTVLKQRTPANARKERRCSQVELLSDTTKPTRPLQRWLRPLRLPPLQQPIRSTFSRFFQLITPPSRIAAAHFFLRTLPP